MRRPTYDDFFDSHYDEAIERCREEYEPDEDTVGDMLNEMYEEYLGEIGDIMYEEEKDRRMGL